MSEPVIRVEGLSKSFPLPHGGKKVQACSDVSFSIDEGKTLGLVGESGSGKTTVGRCLARLLDFEEGEITFRGERVGQISARDFRPYRKQIQIVFQEPSESVNPLRSVQHILEEPLRVHRLGSNRSRGERVREILVLIGLDADILARKPRELSASVLQRVAIGRALITEPSFIVLDEPTSALPPDAKPVIMELLRELQAELGLTYLFISHDLSLVSEFCHDVAVMYLSQIVEQGPASDVLGSPAHPYSQALLNSVLNPDPEAGRGVGATEVTLEGEIPSPIDLPRGCYLQSRCPFAVAECSEPQLLAEVPIAGNIQRVRCWRAPELMTAQLV